MYLVTINTVQELLSFRSVHMHILYYEVTFDNCIGAPNVTRGVHCNVPLAPGRSERDSSSFEPRRGHSPAAHPDYPVRVVRLRGARAPEGHSRTKAAA